jgi:DNA-binding response OmpR family regulator
MDTVDKNTRRVERHEKEKGGMDKKKIMIVDDEKSLTDMLKLMLEKTGKYEILTENKGSQALGAAMSFKPDMLLLDVMMPDMDGGEVARRIKNNEETKDIRVVFLTAAVTREEGGKIGSNMGGYPFIAKPVSMELLLGYVEKNLGE